LYLSHKIFFFFVGFNERKIGDVKRKYKFCSEKYRGAWEDLKNNLNFVLALENVDNFPKIIEEYVLIEPKYFEKMKEKLFWIHGQSIIHLYNEENLNNQKEAYSNQESVSNLLLKVLSINLSFFKNLNTFFNFQFRIEKRKC
jgi:hypothetical protein